jgi:hypothetical protein
VIFCEGADVQHRRPFREDRIIFYASEVHRPDELAHFALGSFLGSLLQAGNIVDRSALARIDVSEISGVQQNDLGPKFIRERNRVAKAFPRAIGKVDRDKDGLNPVL